MKLFDHIYQQSLRESGGEEYHGYTILPKPEGAWPEDFEYRIFEPGATLNNTVDSTSHYMNATSIEDAKDSIDHLTHNHRSDRIDTRVFEEGDEVEIPGGLSGIIYSVRQDDDEIEYEVEYIDEDGEERYDYFTGSELY